MRLRVALPILAAAVLASAPGAGAAVPDPPKDEDLVIGVLDTGVAAQHEAFGKDQVVAWWDFTKTGESPDDRHFDERRPPYDGHGHGTVTAAMAAGLQPATKATPSFAPGTKLAIAKVGTDEGAISGDIAAAIRWAVDVAKADIINISIGTIVPVPGAPLHLWADDYDALTHARAQGVLVTVANGNGLGNLGLLPGLGSSSNYGASLSTLAVGAAGTAGANKSYDPEVAAQYTVTHPDNDTKNGYASGGGTSYASPLVAGFAARLLRAAAQAGRPLPVGRLERLIKWSARGTELPPVFEGYGVIDAAQLEAATGHARNGTLPARPSPDADAIYVDEVTARQKALNNGKVSPPPDEGAR